MSVIVANIRDAVVATIQEAGLTPTVPVIGIYDIVFKIPDLAGTGRIVVCPETKLPELLSRGGQKKHTVTMSVSVQYKYTNPTPAELDPFLAIAESIPLLFLGKKLATTTATCTDVSYPQGLFLQRHIEMFAVFTSFALLTFIDHN